MVLGYGLRDLKAHMNEIIKVTTTGYKYQMNYKKRGWSLFVCFLVVVVLFFILSFRSF